MARIDLEGVDISVIDEAPLAKERARWVGSHSSRGPALRRLTPTENVRGMGGLTHGSGVSEGDAVRSSSLATR